MMNIKNNILYGTVTIMVFAAISAVSWKAYQPSSDVPQALIGVMRPDFRPLKDFQLVDQHGEAFTKQRLRDKWTLVFFGYTSCPDICPMTLSIINSVRGVLDSEHADIAQDMQVVFVSVDPQRDSIEKLAEYMAYFNSEFTGITGKQQEIDNLARQFGAGYALEQETAPGEYLVAHTSAIFLVDPQLRLLAAFSQPHVARTIVEHYVAIREYL